jgi:hypothetical protein
MAINRMDRGDTVELKVFVTDATGAPATGKTVQLAIQRDSDDQYYQWSGGTWGASADWTNATELGLGVYGKSWTIPDADAQYTALWKETTLPAYTAEDLFVDGKLNDISSDVEVHITLPSPAVVPHGQSGVSAAIDGSQTTVALLDASGFEDEGYIIVDSEKMSYTGKSGNTLTGVTRGAFSTTVTTHLNTATAYEIVPFRTKITIHDAGIPKAPNSTPSVTAVDLEDNTTFTGGNMTQEGTEVGVYYSNFFLTAGDSAPEVWEFQYTVEVLSGKTNKYRREMIILDRPSTAAEVLNSQSNPNIRICNQDGYYDSTNTFTAWTDDEVGYLRDDDGNRIIDGEIRWYLKPSGSGTDPEYQKTPLAYCKTDVNGDWVCLVPVGVYEVNIYKSGIQNESVEREVT